MAQKPFFCTRQTLPDSLVINKGVREVLAIEVDTSLPAERVFRVLEQLKESRLLPKQIRVDNGPELISSKLVNWCDNRHIRFYHVHPETHAKWLHQAPAQTAAQPSPDPLPAKTKRAKN